MNLSALMNVMSIIKKLSAFIIWDAMYTYIVSLTI